MGTTLCPYGIAKRRDLGLFTDGFSAKSFGNHLCGSMKMLLQTTEACKLISLEQEAHFKNLFGADNTDDADGKWSVHSRPSRFPGPGACPSLCIPVACCGEKRACERKAAIGV